MTMVRAAYGLPLNCNTAGSQILFNVALAGDTIELDRPIELNQNFQIVNTAASKVLINIMSSGPLFKINAPATVTFDNLRLLSGTGTTARAIDNAGTLTLKNVEINDHINGSGAI